MDLCNVNVPDADAVFQQMVQAAQAAAHAAATQAGTDPNAAAAAVDIEAVRRARIEIIRQAHRERFPLSENLFALIMIVLADLNETQGERLMTAMSLKNIELQTINPEIVRSLFVDLFCTPASALENPMYKSSQSSRSYCIIDYGDIEGYTGFWVEDDETHEEGFLQDTEDVFWLYDDNADAWKVRRVPGRRLRRGFRKGKGKGKKGKGTKGRRKFVPYGKKKGIPYHQRHSK